MLRYLSKMLLKRFPAPTVIGWSYLFAAVFMLISGLFVNTNEDALRFVCPPKVGATAKNQPCGSGLCSCTAWGVPDDAIFPLIY